MRLISAIITLIVLSMILENFLPWWVIAPVAFIVAAIFKLKPGQGFLAGFFGLFLLWAGMAFFIDLSNEHILSAKISLLFFKSAIPFVIVFMTGLIGGLVAGFAGLAGAFLGKAA
jgi:hypothetical protein